MAVPPAARYRSTLPRIDYADAFLVEPGPPGEISPEAWARGGFEHAPAALRSTLRPAWTALGLKIGPRENPDFVFGWEVRRSTEELVLLGAESRIGMPAELLFERRDGALLFATLIAHLNPFVRVLWAGVGPGHRRVVRRMLENGARRARPSADRRPLDLSAR